MTDDEFAAWLDGRSDDQVTAMRWLRRIVVDHSGGLDEYVNTGRWLEGFVFYGMHDQMVFAIGPKGKTKTTFHMMPYYGSPVLRERHGPVLAPFVTGKSCIAFGRVGDVPREALTDIVGRRTPVMRAMLEQRAGSAPSPPERHHR